MAGHSRTDTILKHREREYESKTVKGERFCYFKSKGQKDLGGNVRGTYSMVLSLRVSLFAEPQTATDVS